MSNPELQIIHDETTQPDLHGQEKLDSQTNVRLWVNIISELEKARIFLSRLGQPDSETFVPAERFIEIGKRLEKVILNNPTFGNQNEKLNLLKIVNQAISYPTLVGKNDPIERKSVLEQKYLQIYSLADILATCLGEIPASQADGMNDMEFEAIHSFTGFYNSQKELPDKINPDSVD